MFFCPILGLFIYLCTVIYISEVVAVIQTQKHKKTESCSTNTEIIVIKMKEKSFSAETTKHNRCRKKNDNQKTKKRDSNSLLKKSLLVFSVMHGSAPRLLHLLLLAELFVRSSPRPAHCSPLCGMFRPMVLQLNSLNNMSKKLHHLVRPAIIMDISIFVCVYTRILLL